MALLKHSNDGAKALSICVVRWRIMLFVSRCVIIGFQWLLRHLRVANLLTPTLSMFAERVYTSSVQTTISRRTRS